MVPIQVQLTGYIDDADLLILDALGPQQLAERLAEMLGISPETCVIMTAPAVGELQQFVLYFRRDQR